MNRISRDKIFSTLYVIMIIVTALPFCSLQPKAYGSEKIISFARPLVGGMDPAVVAHVEESQNMSMLYNSLVTLDRNGNIIPDLAESWDVSTDYKEFTFHLRKGVKFHDGTAFNAQAVKFSFDRMLRLKRTVMGNYLKYADQNSCEVVDDYTIKINLIKPFPIFLVDMISPAYSIVSPDYVKKHTSSDDPEAVKWMTEHACGTGPFKLAEYIIGQKAIFEKFNNYYGGTKNGKSAPKLDKVIFYIIKDPGTASLMLEKGEVDIAEKLTNEQFESLKTKAGINVLNLPMPAVVYLTMDVSKPPFNDINIRKAIAHAINYNEIIKYIEKDNVKRAHGMIPENFLGHNPNMPLYEYDLEKAKKFIKASYHPEGFKTTFLFAAERRFTFEQVATYIQAYLNKIGIEINLEQHTITTLVARMDKGNYGIGLRAWKCILPDPEDIVGWLYDYKRASGGWVGAFWEDYEVQEKVSKAREIADPREREKLYREADSKAIDEAIYIPLYQITNQFAVREEVKNFYWDAFLNIYFWDADR